MNTTLLTWFWKNKRDLPWRGSKNPYYIWVSEIMLQQTQVNTVIPYYERFIQAFPTVEQLASASEDQVLSLWKGLGYYSRARNLWRGARYVRDQFGGVLPDDLSALRTIPGVGEYTAGAIASIAFGKKVPAIDGNVNRVLSRLLGWREPVESAKSKQKFTEKLLEWLPEEYAGDFNQALMDFGALVCTPKAPKCESCPLSPECEAFRLHEVPSFPVKKSRTKVQTVIRLTFVLYKNGQVYLQQRPEGLLARLWEFPGYELKLDDVEKSSVNLWQKLSALSPEQWLAYYREAVVNRNYDQAVEGIIRQRLKLTGPIAYTFSHRKWQIYWTLLDLDQAMATDSCVHDRMADYQAPEPTDRRWVKVEDLDDENIPVAFKDIVKGLPADLSR